MNITLIGYTQIDVTCVSYNDLYASDSRVRGTVLTLVFTYKNNRFSRLAFFGRRLVGQSHSRPITNL